MDHSTLRSFDWAATELGPIASWPASLASIVDVVLAHPWPLLLWWGERSIQIYNEAALRDVIYGRLLQLPGIPAATSWGARWSQLEEAVARVRAGHGSVVLEHVSVAPGCLWSLALSAVPDEHAGVGGVLVSARRDHELARLRSQFAQAPVPIGILRGPQYIVELANPAMSEAWNRAPGEAVGRPLFDAVPDARARFEGVLAHVFSTGEPFVGKEVPFRSERDAHGGKNDRYANLLIAPLRDLHRQVESVIVIGVDVTDEIRARNEMQRLRTDAEAANRSKDEFLAMLGHELRNPLSPISTTLQVMRLRGAEGRELDLLERQVGHLTRLVDDLLDVSRAARGKIELHTRDIELADLVAEALEVTSPALEQRQQVVVVDVPHTDLGVRADPERMVQAISNLLTNAAKYSDPGSRITIRGARTDGSVRLSVRDRGVGIAPDMMDHIFDLFVQQRQTLDRSKGGLGLGLAIVRSIVELHGGTVSAASEGAGKGSVFTIELPLVGHPIAASPRAPHEVSREPVPHGDRGRVLVIDDNEDAALTLGYALEQLGYEVAVAHDGPSALRMAAGFVPDVALVDLGLPVMDGYELAEKLREQRGPADHLHLVAVTGYGQASDRERSVRAGFERHLVKPVDLRVLTGVIAKLVEPRRPHAR